MTIERHELTSKDYEREAEATRNRLADTLDELHDRLTPGHVLDEVLTYTRGGGAGFMRALTNAARENPLPTLLIGAGCAMFLAEKTGVTRRAFSGGNSGSGFFGGAADAAADTAAGTGRSVRSAMGTAADTVADQAGSLAGSVRDSAASVGDNVAGTASRAASSLGNAASSVGSTVSGTAAAVGDSMSSAAQQARRSLNDGTAKLSDSVDQLKEGAVDLSETVQDYAASAREQITDTAERTHQQASNLARQFKDTANSLLHEQPLLVAAFGIAVGAAIAAALPKSKLEDELMGEASDAMKETIGEVAAGQYETAKEVAGVVADHAMAKAKEEGLTPSGVAEAARNIGEKAKRVASEAAGSAAATLEDKADSKKS
jgi:X-X-X-Leu-X-X-Gly heptad repeat protein